MGNLPMLSDDCEEIRPGLSLSASGMLPGEKEFASFEKFMHACVIYTRVHKLVFNLCTRVIKLPFVYIGSSCAFLLNA